MSSPVGSKPVSDQQVTLINSSFNELTDVGLIPKELALLKGAMSGADSNTIKKSVVIASTTTGTWLGRNFAVGFVVRSGSNIVYRISSYYASQTTFGFFTAPFVANSTVGSAVPYLLKLGTVSGNVVGLVGGYVVAKAAIKAGEAVVGWIFPSKEDTIKLLENSEEKPSSSVQIEEIPADNKPEVPVLQNEVATQPDLVSEQVKEQPKINSADSLVNEPSQELPVMNSVPLRKASSSSSSQGLHKPSVMDRVKFYESKYKTM